MPCKELEEKKIEILQKDVKIYLQENSAKAKGTLPNLRNWSTQRNGND